MKNVAKTERPKDRKTGVKSDTPDTHDLSSVELQSLASAADCSISYVSRVFSHDPKQSRGLTLQRAHAFASHLGVTLDDLWKMVGSNEIEVADSDRAKKKAKTSGRARVRK